MHTVELLRQAVDLAARLGYQIRQEWIGGSGGGDCQLHGRKVFFLDLALGPEDQLDQIIHTLRRDPETNCLPMPHTLRELLKVRETA